MIHSNSKIIFHKIRGSVYPDEKQEYAIVRWDTDESVRTSKEVLELIHYLSQGQTVHDAARKASLSVNEAISLLDSLNDAGFIKKVDHKVVEDNFAKIKPWLPNISQSWFSWIIKKPVLIAAYIFIISGIVIGITTPGYFPSYRDYFWSEDYLYVFISVALIDMFFLFIHELGHFAVTKAIGGEATIRFSSRFIYVVAETESYHLEVLPKTLRYLVYFAGMFVDFFIIACVYWFLYVIDWKGFEVGLLRNFLMILVLLKIQGIVWQYNAFLETDTYNFLSDFLSHDNLNADAKKLIGKKLLAWTAYLPIPFKRKFGRFVLNKKVQQYASDTRSFHKKERFQVVFFSIILITGLIFTFFQFAMFTIPKDLAFLANGFINTFQGFGSGDGVLVAKSALLMLLILYPYIMLIYVSIKKDK